MHPLVHGGRRDLSRWAGDEGRDELLLGIEMREVMNCYGVAMKKQSSYLYLLMHVSALVYTVQS